MSTSTGSTGSTGPGSRFKPRFPLPIFPRGRRGRMRVVVLLVGLVLLALFGGFYMFSMPGQSYTGPLPPLTTEEQGMADRMKRHVEVLAREIGARSTVALKGLRRAERYVEATLRELGFTPSVQPFDSDGVEVKNFEAEIRGETRPEEIVVVGAHYDSFLFVPAANDNASGVAALLEIARELRGARLACTVKFVVFVNEEPPHFARDTMGSRIYAQAAKKRGDRITGMLALETIGYYSNQKGSQHYPPPFFLVLPGHRQLHRLRGQPEFPPAGAPVHRFVSRAHTLSIRGRGRTGLDQGHRLVRPPLVLARRVSGAHDHGYRALPVSLLPHSRGHTGKNRLRIHGPGHRRSRTGGGSTGRTRL